MKSRQWLCVCALLCCASSADAQLTWWPAHDLSHDEVGDVFFDYNRNQLLMLTKRPPYPTPGPVSLRMRVCGRWEPLPTTGAMPMSDGSLFEHRMVFDRARGVAVMLGRGGLTQASTWEWDGAAWQHRQPAVSPYYRHDSRLVWDSARRRVLLISVASGLNLWDYDGNTWRDLGPASAIPYRSDWNVAYDERRQRLVLFGGYDYTPRVFLNDTWEWDGVQWLLRVPSTSPPGRTQHGMTYDATRGRVVLFGGGNDSGPLTDTWEWDGVDWREYVPQIAPPAGTHQFLAFDPVRQRTLLFGNSNNPHTWEWDGAQWSRSTPEIPRRVQFAGMAYDSSRRRTVMHGSVYLTGQTWEWDGVSWTQHFPSPSPSALWDYAMAYDRTRQRTMLFGGQSISGVLDEFWEWDGQVWRQVNSSFGPAPRGRHQMVYDSRRQRVVLFGGEDWPSIYNDTWEWDGIRWHLRQPATSPPAGYYAMAFNPGQGRTVLFGSSGGNHRVTWEWDGSDWSRRTPAGSPWGRQGHAMAYDPRIGSVVVSGGHSISLIPTYFEDLWGWDGQSWTDLQPSGSPGPRQGHAMAFDEHMGRMVLHGGSVRHWMFDGTWVLGNLQPSSIRGVGSPCPRTGGPGITAGLAYLGNPAWSLDLVHARASAPCVLGISVGSQSRPLGGGCELYLDGAIDLRIAFADPSGHAFTVLPIPVAPFLNGLTFYSQGAVLDPNGPYLGLTLSRGLEVTIGN